MTPRPPESATWATALAITSGSRVESTCATDGAVRPKPISRVVVVGMSVVNIVKEATAWRSGSADPEDHGSLHNEVDHRGGALRDHERDRYRPGPIVQKRQAKVVEPDLYGEGDRIKNHDRDEAGGAR